MLPVAAALLGHKNSEVVFGLVCCFENHCLTALCVRLCSPPFDLDCNCLRKGAVP